MLLISDVFFMLFIVFGAKVYNTKNNDPNNHHEMKVYNALEFTSLGIYSEFYLCAHWLYTMKYWVTARQMEAISNGTKKELRWENAIYYGVLFLNIAFSVYFPVEEGIDGLSYKVSFELWIGI